MNKPATIERDAFYAQDQVKSILGISNRAIGDACRSKQLRSTQRAGRRFFRGAWLIDWLEGSKQSEPSTESDAGREAMQA